MKNVNKTKRSTENVIEEVSIMQKSANLICHENDASARLMVSLRRHSISTLVTIMFSIKTEESTSIKTQISHSADGAFQCLSPTIDCIFIYFFHRLMGCENDRLMHHISVA